MPPEIQPFAPAHDPAAPLGAASAFEAEVMELNAHIVRFEGDHLRRPTELRLKLQSVVATVRDREADVPTDRVDAALAALGAEANLEKRPLRTIISWLLVELAPGRAPRARTQMAGQLEALPREAGPRLTRHLPDLWGVSLQDYVHGVVTKGELAFVQQLILPILFSNAFEPVQTALKLHLAQAWLAVAQAAEVPWVTRPVRYDADLLRRHPHELGQALLSYPPQSPAEVAADLERANPEAMRNAMLHDLLASQIAGKSPAPDPTRLNLPAPPVGAARWVVLLLVALLAGDATRRVIQVVQEAARVGRKFEAKVTWAPPGSERTNR